MVEQEVFERANEALNKALIDNENLKQELARRDAEIVALTNRANSYRNALLALAKEIN